MTIAPVDREALVVGMTLVPALVSRNRSFALFEDPEVRRARVRAALLRGIVRQLSGTLGKVEALDVVASSGARDAQRRRVRVRRVPRWARGRPGPERQRRGPVADRRRPPAPLGRPEPGTHPMTAFFMV